MYFCGGGRKKRKLPSGDGNPSKSNQHHAGAFLFLCKKRYITHITYQALLPFSDLSSPIMCHPMEMNKGGGKKKKEKKSVNLGVHK